MEKYAIHFRIYNLVYDFDIFSTSLNEYIYCFTSWFFFFSLLSFALIRPKWKGGRRKAEIQNGGRYHGFSCRFVARQRGRGLIHYVATAFTLEGGFSSVAHNKDAPLLFIPRSGKQQYYYGQQQQCRREEHKVRSIHIIKIRTNFCLLPWSNRESLYL